MREPMMAIAGSAISGYLTLDKNSNELEKIALVLNDLARDLSMVFMTQRLAQQSNIGIDYLSVDPRKLED
ncbi:hypothetical protein A2W14_03670 [Candidatus Gottesmanbacteria bacterium RBG_16_37_8]|uniref:Uncharacterized protein n=1 Tax=Candidatus Gottesmanbacteria bacterium RBG_16_37_8 TaxID=1798371 RepID=A0A1F5YSL8_9BACT|nr:MAG: hypothetical protein A2W14_03670 [Candidatus Gottesmanbacteria bacterium RBG_16_37_8]